MPLQIRPEENSDTDAIHAVTTAAFLNAAHTDHTEQFIVKALRDAGALTVSLVAEQDGKIVGHVALSPVVLSSGAQGWYGLGPISVLPEQQGGGIGAQLMQAALQVLREHNAAGCVLLGDPAYYRRFGFRPEAGLVLPGVPAEYFQALVLAGPLASGEVSYHPAFSARA